MALNNTTADAVAVALCTALGVVDTATINCWKTIMRNIYAGLKVDIGATLPMNTVITTGSAATQTGPTTPVTIVIS